MIKLSRRGVLVGGLAAAASATGIGSLLRLADRYGWLAPDRAGLFGAGEVVTYGAQRLLMAHDSMAREFSRSQISSVAKVNHGPPDEDPYASLLEGGFQDWRLKIEGLVARPGSYSMAELKALPSRSQVTQLICEEGWSYIAEWTGLPLATLLELVGAHPAARWVVFYPFDDFWGSIDMVEALHTQTLLAYAMNGEDLTPGHGAPIRLRVPRQVGYKNLKFIDRIAVVDSLSDVGDGTGSATTEIGYSWWGGI